jgi:urease accessory protein
MIRKIQQKTATEAASTKSVKQGLGRLTASYVGLKTRLTEVAHKFPTRLLPIGKSSVEHAGAAVCALSSYGAGMIRGDSAHLTVNVEDDARLGLITQGASRIYTPRSLEEDVVGSCNGGVDEICEAQLTATVGNNATMVYAPDPCALYARSSFLQNQIFHIHPESSVALIDWFSSGRYMNNEQWEFDQLCSRTQLRWIDDSDDDDDDHAHHHHRDNGHTYSTSTSSVSTPFLQDTIAMDLRRQLNDNAHGMKGINCFASLILYGRHIQPIRDRCLALSDAFTSQHTRIRSRGYDDDHHHNESEMELGTTLLNGTSGEPIGFMNQSIISSATRRVVMGVSHVPLEGKPSDACVVRLAASTNEDLYRVFHHVLLPMKESFGIEFYKERIRAQNVNIPCKTDKTVVGSSIENSSTGTKKAIQDRQRKNQKPQSNQDANYIKGNRIHDNDSEAFWSTLMLADSILPTGSFAHSAGLEAAAQLGLISNERDVEDFVQAATRSTMQLVTPFLIAGHYLAVDTVREVVARTVGGQSAVRVASQWRRLHRQCQAVMVTNGPACAASLDQGKSLARVASQWIQQTDSSSSEVGSEDLASWKQQQQLLLDCLTSSTTGAPHIAPTLGVIGGLLGLDEVQVCRLFAYCISRDIVSAAVRLSLVGPLASVPLLHKAQYSAEDGIQAVLPLMDDCRDDPMTAAAASAPVIEAVQPCHESLQVRLFRS